MSSILKKIFLLSILQIIAFHAQAQTRNFTVWYGVSFNSQINEEYHRTKYKFDNFGIDYSHPLIGKMDWTAGLNYNSKTGRYGLHYLQAEGNVSYKFLDQVNDITIAALTGPYIAYLIKDDSDEWIPCAPDYESISFGWQIGAKVQYKRISLKAGYELALNPCIPRENYTIVYDGQSTVYKVKGIYPYKFFLRIGFQL